MVVKIQDISFRTIIVVDSKQHEKLTERERDIIFDVYQHSKYVIKISDKDINTLTEEEMFNWCWENLSHNCYVSILIETKGNIIGHFENEEDAVGFRLRWM